MDSARLPAPPPPRDCHRIEARDTEPSHLCWARGPSGLFRVESLEMGHEHTKRSENSLFAICLCALTCGDALHPGFFAFFTIVHQALHYKSSTLLYIALPLCPAPLKNK